MVGVNGGSLAVGRSFDDRGVGVGGEPVDGGLGQERVGGHGEPVGGFAVAGDDGGVPVVSLDDEFVEVGGGGGVQRAEGEVVDAEQVDADEGVFEPRVTSGPVGP